MKVTNAITAVESSISTIFSKEDVLAILKNLEMPKAELPKGFMEELIKEITNGVRDRFDRAGFDEQIVDLSSAEFDINYDNRLELTRVDVDVDEIVCQVHEVVEEMTEKTVCKMFPQEEEGDIVELERAEQTHDEDSIS